MKLIVILILVLIISIGVFYLYNNNKNIEKFTDPDPKYTDIVNALYADLRKPTTTSTTINPILPAANDDNVAPGSTQTPPAVPGSVIATSTISSSPLTSNSNSNSNSSAPVLTTVSSTQTVASQNVPVLASKTSSLVNFIAVIETFKPWGAYFAGNLSEDNKLLDLFNRTNRNAVITGPLIKASAKGFGATNNIDYISGNTNTVVEWGQNSIPYNSTICSITRYTGNTNNKRILTARNAIPANDWIHGHQSGKRGIVLHNDQYITDNTLQIAGDINDWVVTCASSGGTVPGNVYINGVAAGVKSGGIGALQLAINKIDSTNIISESSDFALSYVIIWDTILSNDVLKIVSDNLVNYLASGEPLIFDTLSLNVDDKTKVQNVKSSLIFQETQNALNALRTQMNTPPPATPTTPVTPVTPAPAPPPPTSGTVTTSTGTAVQPQTTPTPLPTPATTPATVTPTPAATPEEAKAAADAILLRAANLENILAGKDAVATAPANNVINLNAKLLNNQTQAARSSICTLVNKMPSPEMSSFTQDVINIPLTSTNTADQAHLWCKCDGDDGVNANTKECKMFDVCRKNYANNNKLDYKATFTTINKIDKQTYDSCTVVFENFPRYLDANTSNQNRPPQSI
jgi:hypothetical protein